MNFCQKREMISYGQSNFYTMIKVYKVPLCFVDFDFVLIISYKLSTNY